MPLQLAGELCWREARATTPHQPPRTEGSSQCLEGIQSSNRELNSTLPGGQLDSSFLHQERRRHKIPSTMPYGVEDAAMVRQPSNPDPSQTHSRSNKPGLRQSVERSISNRMVLTSPCGQLSIQSLGQANDRSVRNQPKPQTPTLLQPTVRPSLTWSRLSQSKLERNLRVCLSTQPSTPSGSQKDSKRAMHDHSYCSSVAITKLVLPHSQSTDSQTPEDTINEQTPIPEWEVSCQPETIQLSRLAAFKQSRTQEGFSEKATSYADRCIRESSHSIYAGRWRVFSDWCSEEQVNTLRPSASQLIDFLIYLFEDRKLSVSSIKGYRSAISHVLGRSYPSDSTDMMGEVIRGMTAVAHTPAKSRLPKWDMTVVLKHLSKPSTNLR